MLYCGMRRKLLFALFILTIMAIVFSVREKPGKIPIFNARTGKVEQVARVVKTNAQWRKTLTPEQFIVLLIILILWKENDESKIIME